MRRREGAAGELPLDQVNPGQSACVREVGGTVALGCRLMEMGLLPGTPVSVTRRAPFGDPIELRVRGYSLSIRAAEAHRVIVELLP